MNDSSALPGGFEPISEADTARVISDPRMLSRAIDAGHAFCHRLRPTAAMQQTTDFIFPLTVLERGAIGVVYIALHGVPDTLALRHRLLRAACKGGNARCVGSLIRHPDYAFDSEDMMKDALSALATVPRELFEVKRHFGTKFPFSRLDTTSFGLLCRSSTDEFDAEWFAELFHPTPDELFAHFGEMKAAVRDGHTPFIISLAIFYPRQQAVESGLVAALYAASDPVFAELERSARWYASGGTMKVVALLGRDEIFVRNCAALNAVCRSPKAASPGNEKKPPSTKCRSIPYALEVAIESCHLTRDDFATRGRWFIVTACIEGDLVIIEWLVTWLGITDMREGFARACVRGNLTAAKWLDVNLHGDQLVPAPNDLFRDICASGQTEMARWFTTRYEVSKAAMGRPMPMGRSAFFDVCANSNRELAVWLADTFDLGGDLLYCDGYGEPFPETLETLCTSASLEMLQWLFNRYPPNRDALEKVFATIDRSKHRLRGWLAARWDFAISS